MSLQTVKDGETGDESQARPITWLPLVAPLWEAVDGQVVRGQNAGGLRVRSLLTQAAAAVN